MKKIVTFIFILQLLIMSLYGLLAFKGITINNFLFENKSSFMVTFWDYEEYEFFLDLIKENELTVYRYVFPDSESLNIYTSNITLNGEVKLLNGSLPNHNTTEFISNIDTGESTQSGIFATLYPNTAVNISHIDSIENFNISGIYYLSSVDLDIIDNILYELSNNIQYVELLGIGNKGGAFFIAINSMLEVYEFLMITILIFLCILMALAQYSISQLKSSSILLLHGYSKFKLIKITILKIVKLLVISSIIAYLIFFIYLIISGYFMFLSSLSFYFFVLCIALVTLYTIMVNIFIFIYLYKLNLLSILKGKKPYYLIQIFNHFIKLVFTIFLLINIYFSVESFTLLNQRIEALSNWEKAENYYRTLVSTGETGNLALDLELNTKMIDFYKDVSNYHNGFIINAHNFYWLDKYIDTLYKDGMYSPAFDRNIPPKIQASNGKSVTISPNYLNVNPIIASNNIPIQEQIIYDDYILNILVPEKLRPYEQYILIEYLHYFHFQKVDVENIYNKELNRTLNTTPIEDLSIHIIYVEDEQEYFTFNYRVRPEDRNMVKDPIAFIYTGNVDPSFLFANITSSFFFYTESSDAYSDILPLIIKHDLQSVIRQVDSAYDQQGMAISKLQQQYIRSVSFSIILFIANFTVTYNLMANYFEKNKYKLLIKSLFGYNIAKRNKYFIAVLLTYSLIAITIIGLNLGTQIFFIGLLVMLIDTVVAGVIESKLLNKSFSKIIKGER